MTLTTHRHREVAEGPAPGEALQIGRYVVLGRLGEGAMGVVYRAYDELLDRKVALKLLQHTGRRDGPARVRLQREAQALAQLSHPNVVQIYDVGEWNGEDFVALEFVRGQTLTTWLIERPRPWQAIVEVFVQAGRGLAAAHAADLVHRDFKPKSDCPPQTAPLPPSGRILADRGDLRGAVCRVMPRHAAVLATAWQRASARSHVALTHNHHWNRTLRPGVSIDHEHPSPHS